MVILSRGDIEKIDPPVSVNFHTVCYWDPVSQTLLKKKENGDTEAATLLGKAKKFLEFNCVEKVNQEEWTMLPIQGYNTTTYKIKLVGDQLVCNCQGFKTNKYCSHCLAVTQYEFIEDYNSK
jgi:hypothetical protein